MAIKDISQMLASYKGLLGWTAANGYPDMEIELFIKDHPVPVRKPKISETITVGLYDSNSGRDAGFKGLFYGLNDPLSIAISGWMITPLNGQQWQPKDKNGTNTSAFLSASYADIITGYLMGSYSGSGAGGYQNRRDPSYYISPHGYRYEAPVITTWDPSYTVNRRKQAFSMTLLLEK